MDAFIIYIVECVQSPAAYLAHCLHDAVDGVGTDDATLIRIIVSRSEIDLGNIKEEYERIYNRTLLSAVKVQNIVYLDYIPLYYRIYLYIFYISRYDIIDLALPILFVVRIGGIYIYEYLKKINHFTFTYDPSSLSPSRTRPLVTMDELCVRSLAKHKWKYLGVIIAIIFITLIKNTLANALLLKHYHIYIYKILNLHIANV